MIKQRLNSLKIGQKMGTIVIIAVAAPFLVLSFFLAGNIYDAALSHTIQRKQTEISKIEPLVNRVISNMVEESSRIQSEDFYSELCDHTGELSPSLLQSEKSVSFFEKLKKPRKDDKTPYTVRIYADLPETDDVFSVEASRAYFFPGV